MDRIEFENMIRVHGPDLLRFCLMTTSNRTEGDELYQDTLLKLWEKRDKLDIDISVKSYALSTAIRLWKNQRRKAAWRHRIAPQVSYESILEGVGTVITDDGMDMDPLIQVIEDEEATLVHKCVMELPDRYAKVILLHYTADLSVSEIADCLHISVNTVKTRLRRSREILRKRLEDKL